jgi:large subunit ribosomal protein L1
MVESRNRNEKKDKLVIEKSVLYSIDDALLQVKKAAAAKFDESVDISVKLGVDPKKSDQVVRGAVVLPAGTGKNVRVAVFASGEKADMALAAGADKVGLESLIEDIKAGIIDFDVVIASPETMKIVSSVAQILGPKGLMPNPKVGTVSTDVVSAVKNAKAGQVQYRTDKAGIVHCSIGKTSFSETALKDNLNALLDALSRSKPASSKGVFLRKVCISSTMGLGSARVDIASFQR